ncbi:TPA: hypothetical protein ACJEU7_001840 [Acinetobacter baumannii]|uniref:hypothetical protein n=1 Tax=Acinetobacter baumannii TaxID=470 RepID=UPI00224FC4F9|nr:hypothetical protein [Acinetobacter baumannii]MCX3034033.1 hypothetical protein [Acinetobacter baumannii]
MENDVENEKFDREAFVDEFLDSEYEDPNDPDTPWGKRLTERQIQPRVLKRYDNFLKYLAILLISVALLLTSGLSFLTYKFLFSTSFEILVFNDGTDLICIYDPDSGKMTHAK